MDDIQNMGMQALQDIKVLDFSWIVAGPLATKYLGDHGATVIKVESTTSTCPTRGDPPMAGGIVGTNRSGEFGFVNNSKYSITLNIKHPRGLDLAKRLVEWADVVVENFTAQTMERLGLGYEELKKIKPDIIMARASLQGQTGTRALQPGNAWTLKGLAGFTGLVGWPDRQPTGPTNAYTDYIAAMDIVLAIIGALDYRARTGKGQCIDLSQFESSVDFLCVPILDYLVNQRVQGPDGNRCSRAAPHGAYQCKGDDRWCAIAVFNDLEWKGFCQVIGDPDWTREPRFATMMGRKQNEDDLDRFVENWTINRSAEEVMELLQEAGVPAGIVENAEDTFNDPQLNHRRHYRYLDHPEIGKEAIWAPPFALSKTPVELTMPAPNLGQHNEYVFTKILGIPEDEFVELLSLGVLD